MEIGYAEKYDGTCNEISSSKTLYFDINVLTDGTLENGKITINGQNFDLQTALVKDEVLKNDYISSNTTSIELNDISYGTQKLFYGTISADIENNINNYSRSDNTVVLTGTWVSTDGTESVDIKKEINLTVDWYGITSTTSYSNTVSTTHDISTVVGTDTITLSFNVAYKETAEQLLIQKQVTEVSIPDLNGYSATSVIATSQNCTYEYSEENKLLTITREATVDANGNITSSVSRLNTYSIQVEYPIEAYESISGDTISLTFPTTGYYYGYNNSNEEFSNPYISSASKSWTHTWRQLTGSVARFDVIIGKYVYNPDTKTYRYVISKELPLQLYNGLGLEDDASDEYIVQWRAYSGTTYTNQNGFYMEETKEDYFLNSSGEYISTSDYVSTKGIYVSGAGTALGDDGWIKIYDSETDELLVTFTADEWNTYTSSNPYYFAENVSGIKVETSKVNSNSYFYVYQVKEIDDEAIYDNFTAEEFENLDYIYSYLKGSLYLDTTLTSINTDQAYAYYEAPVSLLSFSISPTAITNQETKTVNMTITTESSRYNESKWQNGMFVIELPEEILAVDINEVTISDSSVEITAYETYEENGKQYIRIYTSNDEETTYTIKINADVTADPREPTVTKSVKLYAINEYCQNYRTTSRAEDTLDINSNNNTSEYVLYKTASLQIVAPSSLLTSQTLSNYDDEGSEVVSPQIAIIDKSSNSRDATINVSITNNYSGTISEAVIVGKIPFEGNSYQINGSSLGSTYSVTMKNTGIIVPEALEEYAVVYYSTNEIVTNDLTDESNNWKTADEVADWSQIKTYAIDISSYTLQKGESFTFSYDIEIPANINYNDVTYSTHAIYFCLDTEDGKLQTKTEVNRLGIMIAKKYAINLTKYKEGTTTKVQGATYKITDGDTTRTGITDENGNIEIAGLYVDKEYTLTEIASPSSYILNENEIIFKLTIDDDGNPQIVTTGTLRSEATTTNEEGIYTLNLEVEDSAKYDVSIVKTDSTTGEALKGVKFRLTGGSYGTTGRIFSTDANGTITMTNLLPGTEYTLQETKATGYYLNQEAITFTVSRNSNGELEIVSSDSNFTNANIVEEDGVDKAVVNVNITNDAIPTYTLNILKKNTDGETLSGTQFKLTSTDTGEVTYLVTDENGKISLDGLYQYVDGKYITGEYTLQEISATEGYITDQTEIKFTAELETETTTLNIQFSQGEETVLTSSSTENSITLEIENEPIFKLTKIGDNGTLLPNAKFKIVDLDGNYVTDVNGNIIGELENGIYVLTTDENGEITADLPEGLYMAIEVEAPEGYELPEDEEDRTYYIGIGESRPEETEFNVEYATQITGAGHSNVYDVQATSDGGYITAGSFAEDNDINNDGTVDETAVGDFDILVTKFDTDGKVEWYYNDGSAKADEAYAISICPDGGYIVAGYETTSAGKDGVIIKLTSSGTLSWKKYLSGEISDIINGVEVLTSGDIVVAGKFDSTSIDLGRRNCNKSRI